MTLPSSVSYNAAHAYHDVGDGIPMLGVSLAGSRFRPAYISSATTTQVATGPGFLHAIIVGETAAGAISIIDNITGSTVNIGTLKASIVEGTYVFNVPFTAGLRIITAGASKITVVYRAEGTDVSASASVSPSSSTSPSVSPSASASPSA